MRAPRSQNPAEQPGVCRTIAATVASVERFTTSAPRMAATKSPWGWGYQEEVYRALDTRALQQSFTCIVRGMVACDATDPRAASRLYGELSAQGQTGKRVPCITAC